MTVITEKFNCIARFQFIFIKKIIIDYAIVLSIFDKNILPIDKIFIINFKLKYHHNLIVNDVPLSCPFAPISCLIDVHRYMTPCFNMRIAREVVCNINYLWSVPQCFRYIKAPFLRTVLEDKRFQFEFLYRFSISW